MASGGGLRWPAVVHGGGGTPEGLWRQEGAEEVRLGSVKLKAMLVRSEDQWIWRIGMATPAAAARFAVRQSVRGEEQGVVHGRVKGRPQGLWGRFFIG
jgi:hypothetical protein